MPQFNLLEVMKKKGEITANFNFPTDNHHFQLLILFFFLI